MKEKLTVTIKERVYQYESDFPEGWVFAKGDSFKKVKIDKHTCFTKRFEVKMPENISGWNLMTTLKGKNENNLARIYDIVGTKENAKNIYYVFYEFIDGDTLNNLISKHIYVDLERLTENLFAALNSLQRKEYWFPDFVEKNIFCPKMGGYVLIDLDSVQPLSEPPDNDMWADKEYWALVFNFYKSILDKSEIHFSDVNGISLNYLIIFFLVLRLKIYQSDTVVEYHELFNDLPVYLSRISPLIAGIFEKIYQNPDPPGYEDINAIRDLIRSKIITLTEEKITRLIGGEELDPSETIIEEPPVVVETGRLRKPPVEPELPIIAGFESNAGFIEKGQRFYLKWEVKNAVRIRLFRNGVVINEPDAGKGDIVLIEPFDGVDKEIEFRLLASNIAGDVESKPINIFVKESIIIEDFHERNPKRLKKRQLRWLILVVVLLAIAAAVFFSKSQENEKKISISTFAPRTVLENYTLAISGKNLPTDSNGLAVLFNNQKGTLLFNSENLITVTVPELKTLDSMITLAIVVKGDTFYADKKVVVKKRTN